MLRNLQLQEQQKLVIDYKIQCCILTYLSQVQHSVAVAPVYHFVWAIMNTKIAKKTQEWGRKGVKNLLLREQQKLVVDYKIQCCMMTYLSQVQRSVAVETVYHFAWATKSTKIAKNAQERGEKGDKKPTMTRTTKVGHDL